MAIGHKVRLAVPLEPEILAKEICARKAGWFERHDDVPAGACIGKLIMLVLEYSLYARITPAAGGSLISGRVGSYLVLDLLIVAMFAVALPALLLAGAWLEAIAFMAMALVLLVIWIGDAEEGEELVDWLRTEFGAEDV